MDYIFKLNIYAGIYKPYIMPNKKAIIPEDMLYLSIQILLPLE